MNFDFQTGDIVIFRPDQNRGLERMTLVKEFVDGIFHAEKLDEEIVRVRSSQLIRVWRPSVAERQLLIDERMAERRKRIELRNARIEKNRMIFAGVGEFRIRLTADGLPDKRQKPRYNARNSEELRIKPRSR